MPAATSAVLLVVAQTVRARAWPAGKHTFAMREAAAADPAAKCRAAKKPQILRQVATEAVRPGPFRGVADGTGVSQIAGTRPER